jgi:hypothetical protein
MSRDQAANQATEADEGEVTLGFREEELALADQSWFAKLKADPETEAAVQSIGKVARVNDSKILRE